jgi:hypothetical protein
MMSEQACGAPAEVLERIKKLLRLAGNNPSQHEAELAAAKAQELMDRYKIESAEVESHGEAKAGESVEGYMAHDPIDSTGRFSSWRQRLIMVIANCNACVQIIHTVWTTKGKAKQYRLIGTRTNVEYCRWLYQWVAPQIERLAGEHKGQGKSWINNFKLGVVDGVGRRLQEQRAESKRAAQGTVSTVALAVFDRELTAVKAYYDSVKAGFSNYNAGRSRWNGDARQAGAEAAQRVGLNRPLNSGVSQRRLG